MVVAFVDTQKRSPNLTNIAVVVVDEPEQKAFATGTESAQNAHKRSEGAPPTPKGEWGARLLHGWDKTGMSRDKTAQNPRWRV